MNNERWKQLETIVAAALELDEEHRERFVTDACGDDQDLRDEVEDLLGRETGADRMLGDTVFDATSSEDRLLGSTIGPYRLESLLGFGGMGVVYSVRRTDGEFEQKAALKVIRGWMMGDQLKQRFLVERQVLASLDHPGIARLLDGGTSPGGTPYLVMEHIEGVPIDRHCDNEKLDVGERIRLFLRICEAVTFAHRNLVVHRDIKPANILVEGDGTPKLLDFGIAKILDPSSIPIGQTSTHTGSRPMSPAFASPEHIRGQSINTASDVYSLGAVLYTLLTGRPPRTLDDNSPRALEQAISKAPRLPSDTVAGTGRDTRSRQKRLRGDLDSILLKALREEPEHRYPSVDELAQDLQRHLDGRPVTARRGTLRYRTGRFLRRNFRGVAAAFLAGVVITTSVAALILQNRQISYQRDRAMEMTTFSSGMLEVDPFLWTIDSFRTTGSILWFNLLNGEDQLSADPLLRRDQLILLAKGHLITNHSNESLRLARQAVALNQALPDPMRIDELKTMNDQGAMLIASGDVVEAGKLLDAALQIGRTGTNSDKLEFSRSLYLKALCDWSTPNVPGARRHVQSALRVTTEELGDGAVEVLHLRALLGYLELHENLGSEEAISLLKDVTGQLELQGRSTRLVRRLFYRLVEAHIFRGEYYLAIETIKRIQAFPPESKESGFADLNLKSGDLSFMRGELAAAAQNFNPRSEVSSFIAIQETLLTRSARVQLALGDLTEARLDCDYWDLKMLRWHRYPPWINWTGQYSNPNPMVVALIHLRQGNSDQARIAAAQAIDSIDLDNLGREWFSDSHAIGAQIYHELGDETTAMKLADRAISIADGLIQSWSLPGVRARHLKAEILLASGRAAEAQVCLAELGERIENQRSIDPSPRINEQLANSHRIQGNLHQVQREPDLARIEWREALRSLALNPDGAIGADHHLIAGEVLLRLGESALAAEHARILFDKGWRHPEWVATLGG